MTPDQRQRVERLPHHYLLAEVDVAALRACLAALAAAEQVWQPIETAPKDGSDVLLKGRNWTRVGYWAKRIEAWSVDAGVRLSEPTHWYSLPRAEGEGGDRG